MIMECVGGIKGESAEVRGRFAGTICEVLVRELMMMIGVCCSGRW